MKKLIDRLYFILRANFWAFYYKNVVKKEDLDIDKIQFVEKMDFPEFIEVPLIPKVDVKYMSIVDCPVPERPDTKRARYIRVIMYQHIGYSKKD